MIDSLNHASLDNEDPAMPKLLNFQLLQIEHTLLLGAIDRKRGENQNHFYLPDSVDSYFILDVARKPAFIFNNRKELEHAAKLRGVVLDLKKSKKFTCVIAPRS
jgi:hypothetical protein